MLFRWIRSWLWCQTKWVFIIENTYDLYVYYAIASHIVVGSVGKRIMGQLFVLLKFWCKPYLLFSLLQRNIVGLVSRISLLYSWLQATVRVMSLITDEDESEDAYPGENVKIKVTGVEEEVDFFWKQNWLENLERKLLTCLWVSIHMHWNSRCKYFSTMSML